MTDFLVSFPNLGLEFTISRVAFTLFGIPVYWYGVLIGAGMFLAVLFAFGQAQRFGIDVDRMIDVILVGFVLAIVCGRLYYVLFVDAQYRSFLDLINLRNGGIAIYGGIIGAAIGAAIGCKWRKVPILPMFDITAMGFLIGQSIGRWGNFFNQEAFGDNTNSLFGMISDGTVSYLSANQQRLFAEGIYNVDPYMPVHPTFLYESVWCAVGFFLLWAYSKHRKFNGEIALFYAIWYGLGRFFIEGLRTDSLYIGGVRVSQLVAGISVVAGLAIWSIARYKTRGQPLKVPEIPPHTARVKLQTEDGEETVTISWPAEDKAPSAEERRQLAEKVLEAEKQKKQEEEEEAEDAEKAEPEEKKAEATKAEEKKTETDEAEPPKEAKPEKPKAAKPKAEKPKAEKPKTEKPKAKKPKAEKPEPEEPDDD